MLQIFVYMIFFLGVINIFRMSAYFILSDVYELLSLKKNKKITGRHSPVISIIVPAYNEEKSIYKCLTSIYSSSYKRFQVIVANDGSSDKTAREVSKFVKAKGINNLIYFRQKNSGKAVALNSAIKRFA